MEKLFIPETKHSPLINLDPDRDIFEVTGKSFPEDSKKIYLPLIEYLDKYKHNLPQTISFKFNLFYISSSSIISIKQVLLKLKEIADQGKNVEILWFYDEDDEDIKKTGEDYIKITGLNFKFLVNPE